MPLGSSINACSLSAAVQDTGSGESTDIVLPVHWADMKNLLGGKQEDLDAAGTREGLRASYANVMCSATWSLLYPGNDLPVLSDLLSFLQTRALNAKPCWRQSYDFFGPTQGIINTKYHDH